MKNILTLILVMVASISLVAQNKHKKEDQFKDDFQQEFTNQNAVNEKTWINTTVDLCYHDWNSNSNSWELTYKNSTTYNNDGKIVVDLWQMWDTLANNWVNDEQTTYTFDVNSQELEYVKIAWNSTLSSWGYVQKSVSNYDSTLLLTRVIYDWNSVDSIWEESSKTEFIDYDFNQNLLELIVYSWNSSLSSWQKNARSVNTRDGSGKIVQSISYMWLGSWEYLNKLIYDYDVNGNNIHNYLYNWNVSVWKPSREYFYDYDIYNQQIESRIYQWSQPLASMVEYNKSTRNYDLTGNVIEKINLIWDTSNSIWINDIKWINTYDLDNNKVQTFIYDWNNQSSTWDNLEWQVLCSSITNTNEVQDFNDIEIYPNPSNGLVFLDLQNKTHPFENIKVFTIDGKVVFEHNKFNNNALDLTFLPNGIYYMTIKDESITYRKKLVLMK